MSTKETLLLHVATLREEAAKRVDDYNARAKECNDKEARKALRKETRIARVKRVQRVAIVMQELLNTCSSCEKLSSDSKRYILALSLDAKERETFVIARDDDIMSLVMRYDNFSMKKVEKYCEKHNIVFNRNTKTFDFTNAVDVLDTFDDDSEDEE